MIKEESQYVMSQRLKHGTLSATWQFWKKKVLTRHKTWRLCPKHGDTECHSDFITYQKGIYMI